MDLLLPHQPPEVLQRFLERPLGGNEFLWMGVALRSGSRGRNMFTGDAVAPGLYQTYRNGNDPMLSRSKNTVYVLTHMQKRERNCTLRAPSRRAISGALLPPVLHLKGGTRATLKITRT